MLNQHGLRLENFQIRKALEWMRPYYNEALRVKDLADLAGMSVPSINRHFRTITATSPLQYLKTLRLQAARRIMMTNPDATHAAFSVGYESASQFSREYARFFGKPPKRDSAALRKDAGSIAGV